MLRERFDGPTGAYPHAGRWLRPDWAFDASAQPEMLTSLAIDWRAQGSQIFGACCGLGVDYISALSDNLR